MNNSYSTGQLPSFLHRLGQPVWTRLRQDPPLAALLLHGGLLVALYSALYCFGFVNLLPSSTTLYNWDVPTLYTIKQAGYPDPLSGHNAFFPLVPYVWRFAHVGVLEAGLLNAGLLGIGLYVLAHTFGFSGRQTLLVASAPLLMFALVPYTEGFFFLFGALLLRGLHRHKLLLTCIGLMGCCLTRSAGTLFIPAFLFAEVLTWGQPRSGWKTLAGGLGAILISVGLVMWLQFSQGGDAFAFYKVHALWGHVFRVPPEALFSSAGVTMLWLDAFALAIGIVALVSCAVLGVRWLLSRGRGGFETPISKAVLFALGYSVGATFFIVFYQGGDLVGLSRYLLATPYWGALLAWAWASHWRSERILLAVCAAVFTTGLLVGLPSRMPNFAPGEGLWFFGLLALYASSYWFSRPDRCRWYREVATGLYFLNLFALCFILNLFLNGVWVN